MEVVCTFCKTDSSSVSQCTECQYVYCADTCMNYGPAVPKTFLCPDCSSCKRVDCELAVSKRQPVQVTVLILHIQTLYPMAGYLMNVMQPALESYGVKFVFQFMTLKSCVDDPAELELFLRDVERKGVLLVMLMTDTAARGWWVSESEGETYCMNERKALQRLFCEDPEILDRLLSIRVCLLFVLACGGNLDAAKVTDLHEWNKSNGCFQHMFAFLNTRTRWAEVCGFFAKLMMSAFGRFEPFHRAVVESWCLDETTRYHSGMVWWALHDVTPFALRENTNKCPFGVRFPDVRQKCGCPFRETGNWRIKGWTKNNSSPTTGSTLNAVASCCGYRFSMTLLEPPPRTYEFSGIGYVLDTWPGVGRFKAAGNLKGDLSKGQGTGPADVASGGSDYRVQKRPRTSDVGPGTSKRRGGSAPDLLEQV
eukprot:TRINITY_DN3748_c0_g1_i1.p1 TRINITY_DN3748_c0_g1~~TRINITY_DN3748_c0_g1_i1.p1  ORF type:complete len:423 (-),score=-42.64 TRINITY_DN3748_c0_g1_i1:135-1403(-)